MNRKPSMLVVFLTVFIDLVGFGIVLPQLPLYIDSAGYLRSQKGFDQPVGPGFWERS